FLLAAHAVAGLGAGVTLVLIGDGPERAAITAALPAVRCLGPLPPDQVADACRAADVLVLPSEREGWPNVVTEAIASGLPVVATRVGGIPQILGDPPPAWLGSLLAPGDGQALAAALRHHLDQGADRARIRAFAGRYGWDEPVQFLGRLFRQALAEAA
ncbi:MAG: glycosyltransferase, partial [Planctomycetota bacterium]